MQKSVRIDKYLEFCSTLDSSLDDAKECFIIHVFGCVYADCDRKL